MEKIMTLPIVLTIAGCTALLVGLLGGGVKAKEIEVPKISLLPRIVSSLIGLVLIGIAIRMSPIPPTEDSPTPTIVSPAQILSTSVPPTQMPTIEVSRTEVPSPTTNPGIVMTATAFSVQATQMEVTSQAIAARQKEIGLTQTAAWVQSQAFAGQWYWNGSPGPIIIVDSNLSSLQIDMSAYGRSAATGRILDESTIEVTFDDNSTYIGRLVRPNRIEWSNGTVWEKY
jgi:hypothetical protein